MKRARSKRSRLLVVDACVARSAGESEHPISSACRQILLDILDICHHVVITEDLRQEWNKHQSGYAYKWRGWMARRGKKLTVVDSAEFELDTSPCSDKIRDAIEKDRCLLEAAFSADKIIITRDHALQEALSTFPQGKKVAAKITWFDPVEDQASLGDL